MAEPTVAGVIFHYTGLKGPMGIIKTHEILGYRRRFLNGTGESTFGLARLRELVKADIGKRKNAPPHLEGFRFYLPKRCRGSRYRLSPVFTRTATY